MDGETFDPTLPEASVQTLQLPVILRVTDLENGRSILVRAIDRGPSSPARVIGLDERSRRLLGIGDNPARVQVAVDPSLSEQAAQDAVGGPRLTVSAAPQIAVEEHPLGAPDAAAPAAQLRVERNGLDQRSTSSLDVDAILRTQVIGAEAVEPTALWIDAGRFSTRSTAQAVADAIGGEVLAEGVGSGAMFAVDLGPFQSTRDADGALNRARAGGITGSRIVVR